MLNTFILTFSSNVYIFYFNDIFSRTHIIINVTKDDNFICHQSRENMLSLTKEERFVKSKMVMYGKFTYIFSF